MVHVQYWSVSRITVFLWQSCLSLSVGTDIVAPTEAAGPEKNQTDQMIPQPTIPPSGTQGPASPTPLTSTNTTTTTTTSPTSTTPTTTADASTTTTPTTNTSHPAGTPLPDSTAPSNTSSTTVPTPEPPKSEATTSTATTTTLVTQSTPTSSTSSSQGPFHIESHNETTTVAHQKSTVLPPSSTSAQAKSHADPSQLNDSKCIISSMLVYESLLDASLPGYWQSQEWIGWTTKAMLFFVLQHKPVLTSTHKHTHTRTQTHTTRAPPPVCIFYKHCHHQALHNHGSVWERDRGSHGTGGLKNALFSFFCCLSRPLRATWFMHPCVSLS